MHAVHHSAVGTEDHRIAEIDLPDQPRMIDNGAHGCLMYLVEPIDRVEFVDRRRINLGDGQFTRQLDQTIHVPRIESFATRPEVVLLSHLASVAPMFDSRSFHRHRRVGARSTLPSCELVPFDATMSEAHDMPPAHATQACLGPR